MARTPRPTRIVNFRHIEALKRQFLKAIAEYCPEVLTSLSTDVFDCKITLAEWLNRYGIAGTWLGHAAKVTLTHWRDFPTERGSWSPEPLRKVARNVGEDMFHYTVDADPWNVHARYLDFDLFREKMHRDLDEALDEYLGVVSTSKIRDINDMDKKMKCAALHLFQGASYERIGASEGINAHSSRVARWIKEIFKPL